MFKLVLLSLFTLFTASAVAEDSKVCLPNEAGGLIVLTHVQCELPIVSNSFPYYAYATESDGTLHEGCFDIPSIADAQQSPGIRIIPVVNFIDANDGEVITFHAEWFTEEACPEEI